jgi:16S rRNA processing protein RimM
MSTDNEYIVVGKIGAPYGIKGWVKITSFTESPSDILNYDPWYLDEKKAWKVIDIDNGRQHGKGVVVKIAGFENPEQARLLTGRTIAIKRTQLPKLKNQEYYWSDLEGLTVIDQNDVVLGKVIYLMETGSNDVLVVKGEREFAIPYRHDVVLSIDLETKVIRVNWDLI